MLIEETEESFFSNLKGKYKNMILEIDSKMDKYVLVSNKPPNSVEAYKDPTSYMVCNNIEDEKLCIVEIPVSYYNYFIGKSKATKLKHEKMFGVIITESSFKQDKTLIGLEERPREYFVISIEGEDKWKFKEYVLDKIYNVII